MTTQELTYSKVEKLMQWDGDLDRVRTLERQIARVDAEIDRWVYQLYWLTEEEIRTVEGS